MEANKYQVIIRRPSFTFLTVARENNFQSDFENKNFPLNSWNNHFNLNYNHNSKDNSSKEIFIKKMDSLKKSFSLLKSEKNTSGNKSLLESPKDRRKEIEDYKISKTKLNDFRTLKTYLNKQFQIIKNNYKNGILGIDNIMDKNTFFYKDQQQKLIENFEKNYEKNKRNSECNVIKI